MPKSNKDLTNLESPHTFSQLFTRTAQKPAKYQHKDCNVNSFEIGKYSIQQAGKVKPNKVKPYFAATPLLTSYLEKENLVCPINDFNLGFTVIKGVLFVEYTRHIGNRRLCFVKFI